MTAEEPFTGGVTRNSPSDEMVNAKIEMLHADLDHLEHMVALLSAMLIGPLPRTPGT